MEYSIDNFTKTLKKLMYDFMPLSSEEEHARKHPDRNWHMQDLALGNNLVISLGTDSQYFEIGNDDSEEKAPYYHILQDAQVIRKAGRGTEKSKGSQAFITDPKKRDYGQASYSVSYDKKGHGRINPYYEYRRNVRGSRSLVSKSTHKVFNEQDGKTVSVNRESKYYFNVHFDYIGRNLENIVKILANEFDLELKKVGNDFTEEYEEWARMEEKRNMAESTYFDGEDF